MARKTAKEYKKELEKISNEKQALEARIVKRAKDLCKQHPDIPISERFAMVTTGQYLDIENLHVLTALALIETIEKYLADKHPHKQTRIEGF